MQNFEALKALLHNSSTYYLISVNMDSTYAYVNVHYDQLFRPQHSNLVGQHYSLTIHPEDMGICESVADQCFASPQNTFPATIRKHDGKGGYIATQWDYKATFDQHGQPAGIFCIGYDITAFMATTAALHQMEMMRSHVIRKPIANLVGLLELLKNTPISEESTEIINMITNQVRELNDQTS